MNHLPNDSPTNPNSAWLFDIDGVLTDPRSKVVRHKAIFQEIVTRLERGEPVGTNTGRSLTFVESRFLDPLEDLVANVGLLQQIFVAAEKGAIGLEYDSRGTRLRQLNPSLVVEGMHELQIVVAALIDARYSDTMFLDRTKQSMVTIEMVDHCPLHEFQRSQRECVPDLMALLTTRGLDGQVRLDPTQIAIDIEHLNAGKALGARIFLDFLRRRRIDPRHIVTFGDSASDFEMAEEASRHGFPVEFVFVGDHPDHFGETPSSMLITRPAERYDDGTLWFLQQHASS